MHYDEGPSVIALRELLTLVEKGGVTAAAEALETTQPTLSRKLQPFKRPLGADRKAILKKRGKSLELTDKGRAILPAVRELLHQYDQLLQHMDGSAASPQVVRIGLGDFSSQWYLPRALAELRDRDIEYEIETEVTRGRDRILATADGRLDLAIVTHDPLEIEASVVDHVGYNVPLVIEPIAKQPFCVIADKDSTAGRELKLQKTGRSVPLDWLGCWKIVGLDRHSGIRHKIENRLRASGAEPQFVEAATVGGWPAAIESARWGLGIAVVPLASLTTDDRNDFEVRRLGDEFSIVDQLIHRDTRLTVPQREVKKALKQAAQSHQKAVRQRWKRVL